MRRRHASIRSDPYIVNTLFLAGTTLMLMALFAGMQLYAVEALRSNMAHEFRQLACLPDGTLQRRCD